MSEVSERLAEVLAGHVLRDCDPACSCGWDWDWREVVLPSEADFDPSRYRLSDVVRPEQHRAHLADALAPVVELMLAEARAEALREAEADHAEQVRMALEDQRERIGRAIEADRPEMGSDINVTPYRTGLFTGMNRAAGIARADAAEREAR